MFGGPSLGHCVPDLHVPQSHYAPLPCSHAYFHQFLREGFRNCYDLSCDHQSVGLMGAPRRCFPLKDLESHAVMPGFPYQYLWHSLSDRVGYVGLIQTSCGWMQTVGLERDSKIVAVPSRMIKSNVDGSTE